MYRVPPACCKKWKNLSRRLLQLLATVMMMAVICNYDDLGAKILVLFKLTEKYRQPIQTIHIFAQLSRCILI